MGTVKKLILELLSEDSKISTVRLMSVLCTVSGICLAFVGLVRGSDLLGLSALCGVFVGAAFTGKVVQKSIEK